MFDNDDTGIKASYKIYDELVKIANNVRIVVLKALIPNAKKGYDVSDFLETKMDIKDSKSFFDLIIFASYIKSSTLDFVFGLESKAKKIELQDIESSILDSAKHLSFDEKSNLIDICAGFESISELAELQNELYIWNETSYIHFPSDYLEKFLDKFFNITKVDIKKQSRKFKIELIDNLKSRARSLRRIKEKQDYRVITLLNGTLIINSNSYEFISSHDKDFGCVNILNMNYDENEKAVKF